jgi:predicted transcriptional regulator YheO
MDSSERQRLTEFLERLTYGLAEAIGKNCEVVLHDFSDPEKSIVAIANGHITGRKVGDTVDVLGLQLLRHPPSGDLLNYRTETKSGKVLRSSSIFFRDETGKIFSSLCINLDISGLAHLQHWLQDLMGPLENGPHEEFEHSVDAVLDRLIQDSIHSTGKEVLDLTRDDKVAIISYLENKGAFLIRYSVDRIAELLSISKYTIYNYLDEIKSKSAAKELARDKGNADGNKHREP